MLKLTHVIDSSDRPVRTECALSTPVVGSQRWVRAPSTEFLGAPRYACVDGKCKLQATDCQTGDRAVSASGAV